MARHGKALHGIAWHCIGIARHCIGMALMALQGIDIVWHCMVLHDISRLGKEREQVQGITSHTVTWHNTL
jgi:hypothetical protein